VPELASAPPTIMTCPPMRHALRRPRSPASRPEVSTPASASVYPPTGGLSPRWRAGVPRWIQVAQGQVLTCPSDEMKVRREPTNVTSARFPRFGQVARRFCWRDGRFPRELAIAVEPVFPVPELASARQLS